MRKKWMAGLLALALILALAGCSTNAPSPTGSAVPTGGADTDPTDAPAQTVELLKIGTTAKADTFSIMVESGSYGKMNYNSFCGAPFIQLDNNGEIQPFIMTSWDIADDQMSLVATFATDQGITWHDGEPLTIDDIIFTLEYLRDVKKSGYVNTLDTVEKIDETTLRLHFSTPAAFSTLNKMGRFVMVYPKHIWEGVEDYKGYAEADAMIGCGPYKVTDIDQDAQIVTYEATCDTYLGKPVTVRKVLVRSFDSHDALVMALRTGEIDAMYDYSNSLDSSMKPSITGIENLDPGMSVNPGNFQLVFGFNTQPTDDLSFRQAVAAALDYSLLATAIGGEDGEIAGVGVVSPAAKGHDSTLPKNEQDIDKANAILDEAGYLDVNGDGLREMPDGSELAVLITPQYNKTRSALYLRICEIIMQNMEQVGVQVVLDEESVRNSDYCTEFRKSGMYELYVGYTSPGVALFDSAFMYFVPNVNNPWGTYNDEAYAAEYRTMMDAKDYETYFASCKKLQQMTADEVVAIALCWDKAYFPYRTDKYEGWTNYSGWGVINGETWYNLRPIQ